MRFEHTVRYDVAPERVFAMLGDPSFREQVCGAQHAADCSVTVDDADLDQGMSVRVEQQRPAEGIPSFAQRFVGDTIHIVQQEEWAGATDAALEVSVPGKPARLEGTITLRPDGEGTVETVTGRLTVGIPLVGGKIEVLIAELLEHALQAEHRVGTDWLARR